MTTPTLSQFTTPTDGPTTVAKAFYDAGSLILYVIGADGQLYTYQNVPARDAANLLSGPARGMFQSLTRIKWTYTVGPAPTT
jgi:hypothetical protein